MIKVARYLNDIEILEVIHCRFGKCIKCRVFRLDRTYFSGKDLGCDLPVK